MNLELLLLSLTVKELCDIKLESIWSEKTRNFSDKSYIIVSSEQSNWTICFPKATFNVNLTLKHYVICSGTKKRSKQSKYLIKHKQRKQQKWCIRIKSMVKLIQTNTICCIVITYKTKWHSLILGIYINSNESLKLLRSSMHFFEELMFQKYKIAEYNAFSIKM
jgi:hypothetical protein